MKGSRKFSFTVGERAPDDEISYGDSVLFAKEHGHKANPASDKGKGFQTKIQSKSYWSDLGFKAPRLAVFLTRPTERKQSRPSGLLQILKISPLNPGLHPKTLLPLSTHSVCLFN